MTLVPVPDDLVNRLISASRNEQKSFNEYIREVLEQSIRAHKLNRSVKEIVDIYERRRMEKEAKTIIESTEHEATKRSNSVPVLESGSLRPQERITDEMVRFTGDLSIPSGLEIKENIALHGNLRLGSRCHAYGSLYVFGKADVGEGSIVDGDIIADGEVSLGRDAKIGGIVDSGKNIIFGEKATAAAVSTSKSVVLAPGAEVNRKVLAGESLVAGSLLLKARTPLVKKSREEGRRPAPSFAAFFEGKEAAVDERNHLFRSIEDRLGTYESQGREETPREWVDESSISEVFERLLESKMTSETRAREESEEREMLSRFLSQLSGGPQRRTVDELLEEEKGEPSPEKLTVKASGEVFYAGNGVSAVLGDAEIADNSTVDKSFVVKGRLKIGKNCQIVKNLRALGGIVIGDESSVNASIASGDTIELGRNTLIKGDVRSESFIRLSEGSAIYGMVGSGGAAMKGKAANG